MKTQYILIATAAVALTACASMKREAYVVPTVTQEKVVDEDKKITKIYYSQKYYDSAIKITPDNAAEKLASIKMPTPVLISGEVKSAVDYQSRASHGSMRGIKFLGKEYKGGYMLNGKNMFVAKFPLGSKDFQLGTGFGNNSQVNELFCIASEMEGMDINLFAQDTIWFSMADSNGNKTKISPLLTRTKKNAEGKSIYIDFKDCAFVKPE
jgi:hypothetical protein